MAKIILVMGLPGSGKSFFASKLAEALDADYINSDRIRKEMFANRTYSEAEKEKVYDEMITRMHSSISQHKNLVLDATFYKNRIREKFRNEAGSKGDIQFIEVIAPESLIKERLKQTREDSEADFNIYKKIKSSWEPFPDKHLVLPSSNNNIETMLQESLNYLHYKKNE